MALFRPATPAPQGSTALRLALGVWLVVALAAGVRTLACPDRHSVFPLFASSASHWWSDRPLYAAYEGLDAFRYPPFFAVAVTPFEWFGLRAGGVLWTWAGLLTLLAGLWRFARDVLPGEWEGRRLALFLTLTALGALRGLWNAQSNALAVGLLLLAGSAVVRRRWWAAAALLGTATWLKLTPVTLALLFCALWPRRLLGRWAVVLAVGFLVPFLTRPPDVVLGHYRDWCGHLLHSGSGRWPGFRDAWTVVVVGRHLAEGAAGPVSLREPITSGAYRALQLLAAAATLAWCLWQKCRGADPRRLVYRTLGMGSAWLMLFGPAIEHATYVFLAPSLVAAALDPDAWPRGRALVGAAFVLVMVLGWGALTRPLLDRLPVLLAALPAGTALYALWLVGHARADRVHRQSPPGYRFPSAGRRPTAGTFQPAAERPTVAAA